MVQTSEEARAFIAERSSLNTKANHNCWGYKVNKGINNNTVELFSSDDGEPSGTAGKPIIGAIEKNEITNTVIVVSRFFGGHKLGIRGLIDAYSQSALLTIKSSGLYAYSLFEKVAITCGYSEWPKIQYEIEKLEPKPKISEINFTEKVSLSLMIDTCNLDHFLGILESYKANRLELDYQLTGNRAYHITKKLKTKVLS